MFNRIRRAIARTRERYAQRPGNRQTLTPTGPPLTPLIPPTAPTLLLRQLRDCRDVLRGEDTALVRPYILASEQRTRQRSTPTSHGHLIHTCFAPAEAHG